MGYLCKRIPDIHPDTAIEYYNICIKHLVALTNHFQAVFDENLLATSVILRLYEELDGMTIFPLTTRDFTTSEQIALTTFK